MSRALCLCCMTIMESKSVHDFRSCGCENESFLDGGGEYVRIGGKNIDAILSLGDDELAGIKSGKPIKGVPASLGTAILRHITKTRDRASRCERAGRAPHATSTEAEGGNIG